MEYKICPSCDSHDTERVWQEKYMAEYKETWICSDCATEWLVSFGNPVVEEIL